MGRIEHVGASVKKKVQAKGKKDLTVAGVDEGRVEWRALTSSVEDPKYRLRLQIPEIPSADLLPNCLRGWQSMPLAARRRSCVVVSQCRRVQSAGGGSEGQREAESKDMSSRIERSRLSSQGEGIMNWMRCRRRPPVDRAAGGGRWQSQRGAVQ